jgi:hypothetical protein
MRRVRDDAEDQPTARKLTNGHVNDGADDAGYLAMLFQDVGIMAALGAEDGSLKNVDSCPLLANLSSKGFSEVRRMLVEWPSG